jgi:hypothetical protein
MIDIIEYLNPISFSYILKSKLKISEQVSRISFKDSYFSPYSDGYI